MAVAAAALVSKRMASPVGNLELIASDERLVAILWENDRPSRVRLGPRFEDRAHHLLIRVEAQLGEYFAGSRTCFDVPLDVAGTMFQKKAWTALRAIPFGETRTYGALADASGKRGAARAFGAACGRNPLSIIVPCHRAVGSTGALTGFAGGLEAKRFLLDLESRGLSCRNPRAGR